MKDKHDAQQQRDWLWLAIIAGIGLALRAAAIAGFQHVPEGDELAYRSMALNLLGGNGIVDSMGNRAMYNVGYPLLILAPVFFLFGDDLLAVRLVNMCLGGAAIVLCYLVAREAGAGRSGRFIAAAAWALYLPGGIYGIYLAKENLMIPLMLGVMWCALRLARQPSKSVAIGCGVLFGLLALTGNAALSLLAVLAWALLLSPASTARRASLAMLALSAALVISSPWLLRNMQVIGAPVLNTNGGFNLYLGNNPAATGMFISISETPRGPTWDALRKTGEVQASETLKQEAISWAKAHPAAFLALAVKKAAYFWTPPLHAGKGNQSPAEKLVRLLWAIQFLLLIAGAIGTVLMPRLRNRQVALLWLALACYTGVHMLFYVIFRYREPMMPVLTVMTGLVLESLVAARRQAAHPAR
ncbi:glycosyltransferase family 39 protein [Janthinobacterium sp. SUN176]|uniref:ArnT family glycosyltransferase n=1 Tax=Janthinobacterium sp. SUN176 TaxID=3014788 RepID=UPI00271359D1|nr:glycosyltransferase family 39 protein [Janthinobacterium sp. SUN176]MDO8074774.1 glycosyltransferase family 39 protein [Janthinobacterium sp. SUN176]